MEFCAPLGAYFQYAGLQSESAESIVPCMAPREITRFCTPEFMVATEEEKEDQVVVVVESEGVEKTLVSKLNLRGHLCTFPRSSSA